MAKHQRIKKLIARYQDNFLTALEKNGRDSLFKPLTNFFRKINVSANSITNFSFVLLGLAMAMHFLKINIELQFYLLFLTGFADMIDGPTARNNDNVTIYGTWADHTRDWMLVLWASYLIYIFNLLPLEIIILIWVLEIIMIWFRSKNFLIKYLKSHGQEEIKNLVLGFSYNNLQTSIIGRVQFFNWAAAYGLILGSKVFSVPFLLPAGHVFIWLTIIFSALNILEHYQRQS